VFFAHVKDTIDQDRIFLSTYILIALLESDLDVDRYMEARYYDIIEKDHNTGHCPLLKKEDGCYLITDDIKKRVPQQYLYFDNSKPEFGNFAQKINQDYPGSFFECLLRGSILIGLAAS
jgi:hypothetical protein